MARLRLNICTTLKGNKLKITAIITFWLICAVASAGFSNAYFARKYDLCQARSDLGFAIGYSLVGGPVALFVTLMFGGFGEYGWSLMPLQSPRCLPKTPKY